MMPSMIHVIARSTYQRSLYRSLISARVPTKRRHVQVRPSLSLQPSTTIARSCCRQLMRYDLCASGLRRVSRQQDRVHPIDRGCADRKPMTTACGAATRDGICIEVPPGVGFCERSSRAEADSETGLTSIMMAEGVDCAAIRMQKRLSKQETP